MSLTSTYMCRHSYLFSQKPNSTTTWTWLHETLVKKKRPMVAVRFRWEGWAQGLFGMWDFVLADLSLISLVLRISTHIVIFLFCTHASWHDWILSWKLTIFSHVWWHFWITTEKNISRKKNICGEQSIIHFKFFLQADPTLYLALLRKKN